MGAGQQRLDANLAKWKAKREAEAIAKIQAREFRAEAKLSRGRTIGRADGSARFKGLNVYQTISATEAHETRARLIQERAVTKERQSIRRAQESPEITEAMQMRAALARLRKMGLV